MHAAIARLDALKPGLRGRLIASGQGSSLRRQRVLTGEVSMARRADLLHSRGGYDPATHALLRSGAGNPHIFASPSGGTNAQNLSNDEFQITVKRRLRHHLPAPNTGQCDASGLCDGCNRLGCADEYGDSRLSCDAKKHITKFWHDPVARKLQDITRLCGLQCSHGIHAPRANLTSGLVTDVAITGLLPEGGVLYVDVATATVTSKTAITTGDAAVVDGAAAAAAAHKKIGKHRDVVLSGNPLNGFTAFAVEEGGRIGRDAEALIDALVRASSPDPTNWLALKTYCMRSLATTTAKGIARVISRPRIRAPRHRPGVVATGPPTAATLAHIARITQLDGTVSPVPPANLENPFPFAFSTTTTTTTSPMQPAAATVDV